MLEHIERSTQSRDREGATRMFAKPDADQPRRWSGVVGASSRSRLCAQPTLKSGGTN